LAHSSSIGHSLLDMFCGIVADAENFEPRDVKPVPRDQWGGEDAEEVNVDVRTLCSSLILQTVEWFVYSNSSFQLGS